MLATHYIDHTDGNPTDSKYCLRYCPIRNVEVASSFGHTIDRKIKTVRKTEI